MTPCYDSIEQQIEEFEDAREIADHSEKPIFEFSEIGTHNFGGKLYLVCSGKDVFLLNDGDVYAKQLSDEEIGELDFLIVWLGKSPICTYEANDKQAVVALLGIIETLDKLIPDEDFHSVSLASLVAHMRAFLYEDIVNEQKCFYTSVMMSGDQRGTGWFKV